MIGSKNILGLPTNMLPQRWMKLRLKI